MAKNNDSKQFSFRVNLNNADHLKVYRTLMDLNLDIHKSISSFVIKAILQYINGFSEADLTNGGKNKKENLEGYVTRKEIGDIEFRIRAEVMKEVAQLFGNAAMANQNAVTPALMQQFMQMVPEKTGQKDEKGVADGETETTDAALEEMSLLFAQGNFGEE
jgi:hypothetical protein